MIKFLLAGLALGGGWLVTRLGVQMSSGFLWHALRLPVGFFLARQPGELATRVRSNDDVAHIPCVTWALLERLRLRYRAIANSGKYLG